MTNFELQLNEAVNTYSDLSGISKNKILEDCKDIESVTYSIITKIMFMAG